MAGIKTIYVCSNCDAQFPKWSGRCSECGSWGTLREEVESSKEAQKEETKKLGGAALIDLRVLPSSSLKRIPTASTEVDRVLGGGLVPGSLVLLSGEPGIGKSTLVAQMADAIAKNKPVIYASGEESAAQVKSRLERLGCQLDNLRFVSETNIEKIVATAAKAKPAALVIDSIQTVYSALIPAEAGSISQIRAAAVKLLELAKENEIAVLIIGHLTKDGQVAGPKSLEHIVDTVLYLENETNNNYCLLRATKNRFGSVNELGVLEMMADGFHEVKNPSQVFIESGAPDIPGSALGCVIEGSRPFLVDLQALVSKTVFGYPQRKTSGFDSARLQVLSAVISKRTKTNLTSADIILNIVGGLRLSDPGLDLAACAAIISSASNKGLDRQTVVIGEVGLGGETRNVFRLEERLKEATRLGYRRAIIPDVDAKAGKLQLVKVKDLNALADALR